MKKAILIAQGKLRMGWMDLGGQEGLLRNTLSGKGGHGCLSTAIGANEPLDLLDETRDLGWMEWIVREEELGEWESSVWWGFGEGGNREFVVRSRRSTSVRMPLHSTKLIDGDGVLWNCYFFLLSVTSGTGSGDKKGEGTNPLPPFHVKKNLWSQSW